jgi:hypothetical protein
MGQEIPLGSHNLKVIRLEIDKLKKYMLGPEQDILKIIDAGHSAICVHFSFSPASPSDTAAPQKVSPLLILNQNMFSIVDAAEKKYPARLVIPKKWGSYARQEEEIYDAYDFEKAMKEMSAPRDFVAAFSLPKESSGLTLLIKNHAPREGQPKVAAVQLGR